MTIQDTPSACGPVPKLPWRKTPLIESRVLSILLGCQVYMKMEMFQPSGSFKSRGVGNFCLQAVAARSPGSPPVHFYASSGGNAGLAAVMAARSLGQNCTVVVPEATKEFMREKLRHAGGDVFVYGKSWAECDQECRRLLALDPNGVYCPPFDDPAIWEGHSYLMNEIYEDIGRPDAIVTAVGGGGLLIGIMEGLDRYGDGHNVPVLAMETIGAHSLHQSLKEDCLVTLPGITSIATSLGARQVASKAFEVAQRPNVKSGVVTDAQAASACVRLLDDERIAIEVSCGAAMAGIYSGALKKAFRLNPESKVVVVVCGGNSINLATLQEYREIYHEPLLADEKVM